jgi:hypothetical protein
LWVSVDGEYDWPWWCEAESFDIGSFRHEVSLRPDANILVITTVNELDAFQRRYRASIASWAFSKGIDWERVARDHSGIVIAPYQWERRHDIKSSWYYGWDCASGCIWDLTAIAEFTPELTGTVNSDSPNSEKEKGGAK